ACWLAFPPPAPHRGPENRPDRAADPNQAERAGGPVGAPRSISGEVDGGREELRAAADGEDGPAGEDAGSGATTAVRVVDAMLRGDEAGPRGAGADQGVAGEAEGPARPRRKGPASGRAGETRRAVGGAGGCAGGQVRFREKEEGWRRRE